MISSFINKSTQRIPKVFISRWNRKAVLNLKKRKVKMPTLARELVIVFVDASEMKRINKKFRSKNKVTDVLSFESQEPRVLGELVLCLQVIRAQAIEHKLTFNEELGYMLLHGILHLLGFDHEKSAKKAREMFKLQDDVFAKMCQGLGHVTTSRINRDQKKTRSRTRTLRRA